MQIERHQQYNTGRQKNARISSICLGAPHFGFFGDKLFFLLIIAYFFPVRLPNACSASTLIPISTLLCRSIDAWMTSFLTAVGWGTHVCDPPTTAWVPKNRSLARIISITDVCACWCGVVVCAHTDASFSPKTPFSSHRESAHWRSWLTVSKKGASFTRFLFFVFRPGKNWCDVSTHSSQRLLLVH